MSGRVWRVKLKGGNFLVNSFLIVIDFFNSFECFKCLGAGVYEKFDFKSVFRFKYLDYDTVSNTFKYKD